MCLAPRTQARPASVQALVCAHTRLPVHAYKLVLKWNIVGGAGAVEGSEIAPGATPPFERPKFPFLRSAAWGWKCRAANLQSPRGTATATLTALHRHHGLARLTRWPCAHNALAHRTHKSHRQRAVPPKCTASEPFQVRAPRLKGGDLFLLHRVILSVCDIGLCHVCVFV